MPLQYEGANGQSSRSVYVVLWKYFLTIVIDLIYLGPGRSIKPQLSAQNEA